MRSFLKNAGIFILIPALIFVVIETLMPATLFTTRTWEAVLARGPILIGPFYPNIESKMTEQGDLARNTEFSVPKHAAWRTDPIGFRNDRFIADPDILIIGDSSIAGTSLSQDETLASVMTQKYGLSVYSIAPANINTFIELKNSGILESPRVVVMSSIERRIPYMPAYNEHAHLSFSDLRLNPFLQSLAVQIDKVRRGNLLFYLRSRANQTRGDGIQSTVDNRMFFMEGPEAVVDTTEITMNRIVERLVNYDSYCQSIGSRFVFLPVPNKETIFWDLAGIETQPLLIRKLISRLEARGIPSIDTVELFDQVRDRGLMPYHYDDSHWSGIAVGAAAEELAKIVNIALENPQEE
jgi:alginate O-acetyltransferase complex protein AlgJ